MDDSVNLNPKVWKCSKRAKDVFEPLDMDYL